MDPAAALVATIGIGSLRWIRRIVLAGGAALLLGGCVKFYIVGHMDDWSDYFTGAGSADPFSGVADTEISFAKLGIACDGKFREYAPRKSRSEVRCNDQRVIRAEAEALSLSAGKGFGIDVFGNRGEFEFFTDIREYERRLATVRAEVERRKLDVAHLRVPKMAPGALAAVTPPPVGIVTTLPPTGSSVAVPPAVALISPSGTIASPGISAAVPAQAVAVTPSQGAAKPAPVALAGGKRLALVIGNSAYKEAPLRNPVNDARALSASLSALGFEVMMGENLGQRDMTRLVARFGERLSGHDVGMFFFAGHGIQIRGKNYLIPVDAQIGSENSVRAEAVDVDAVLDQLSASPLNVVILDACRNNPFERRFRSVSGGLAQMEAPKGTLIAYSTAPGKVAQDGEGANSTYTTALLKVLGEPGLPVETVFKRVRSEVARATSDAQVPWESSSLTGDFYFASSGPQPAAPAVPTATSTPSVGRAANDGEAELLFWQTIKDSQDPADYRAYLQQYPEGRFAAIARNRLARMGNEK